MLAHLAPSRFFPTTWRLHRRFPREPAFTQGLCFLEGGTLLESVGLYGASSLREVSLSGCRYTVARERLLHPSQFGEGVALWPPASPARAIQLEWRSRAALSWALPGLAPAPPLRFATRTGEGWGLAAVSATALALSDGSSTLYFVAPRGGALAEVAPRAAVVAAAAAGGAPVAALNALCGAHGFVLANIWGEARVAVVHPASGRAVAMLDFAGLAAENEVPGDADAVMNGLAYSAGRGFLGEGGGAAGGEWGGLLLVTGKRWRFCYAVELGGLQAF